MKKNNEINLLKKLLNNIRDLRKYTAKSDDLNDEELYYLQEGYREGLCSAAMILADELDVILQNDPECPEEYPEGLLMDIEQTWWHTHDLKDIGSDDRYILIDE